MQISVTYLRDSDWLEWDFKKIMFKNVNYFRIGSALTRYAKVWKGTPWKGSFRTLCLGALTPTAEATSASSFLTLPSGTLLIWATEYIYTIYSPLIFYYWYNSDSTILYNCSVLCLSLLNGISCEWSMTGFGQELWSELLLTLIDLW